MYLILIYHSFGITEIAKTVGDEEDGQPTGIEKGPSYEVQQTTAGVPRDN
jgi:hypothetical protein